MLSLFIRRRAIALKTFALLLSAIFVAIGSGCSSSDVTTAGPPSLSVFAGPGGGSGNVDGSPGAFSSPNGVATDSAGNTYVADYNNHTIRKITPAGVVSTFAGTAGNRGSADGTGAAARFQYPLAVATDSAGNVYVADTFNYTVRKITPAGVVSTLAGTAGATGSTDGTGSAARFNEPGGIATDSAGNVYVADTGNHTIRKIDPMGVVSTLAGTASSFGSADGTGAAASFNTPYGVAVDSTGNVFVADSGNNTIRQITPAGVVSTLAGTAGVAGSADGTGPAASFSFPVGVAVDSTGTLYVADPQNHAIRKITPAGVVSTFAGIVGSLGSADGTGVAASFNYPSGIAVGSTGTIYVADTNNHTLRKITSAGVVTTYASLAGPTGWADGTGSAARFSEPSNISADSAGNVYVADTRSQTIRKITPAGVVSTLAGNAFFAGAVDGTGAVVRFNQPSGVALDSAGNVYVADTFNHSIRKITPAGVVSTFAGGSGAGAIDGTGAAASFEQPRAIAADSAGNFYVADTRNHTIRKITLAGVVTTLAGATSMPGSIDGPGAAARFNRPQSIAVDSAGNVYVADTNNHTIRKITPAGVVTTLAGTAGSPGSTDGTGAAALFSLPLGITVDSTGNLYVADSVNHTIRKITAAGVVTTVVGTVGSVGVVPGTLPGSIRSPWGVTRFGTDLYISNDNGVLKVSNVP